MNKLRNLCRRSRPLCCHNDISLSNKKGNIFLYILFSFIAIILFLILAMVIPDTYDDMRQEVDHDSSASFLASTTSNHTLSYIGEGVTTLAATRQNSTWLDFDGVNDYLFIEDNDYDSVSFWANGTAGGWFHIVNSSDGLIYEDNITVGNLTLNAFKRNTTGWYFGINETGFAKVSVDTIKFYNDSMNETQVSELFSTGRSP